LELYNITMAALIGIVEGVTEFLPISSTGHLILLVDILGFRGPPGRVFEVVIQFGAILGVCWVYRERLMNVISRPISSSSLHMAGVLLLGFLPAAVIGFLAHDFIKAALFNSLVVSFALILGGVAIIAIERSPRKDVVLSFDGIPPLKALQVGFFQALAMIPGTSRSGATIMGGRLLGLSRGAAAEFSFLLAIPTMLAASGYDLYKNAGEIDAAGLIVLAVGFLSALITAVVTVKWLIGFVSSHSFEGFGWYRIAFGTLMLILMYQFQLPS
jgi:undecaprenyl-diphosphatase